jgi:hypothetical protein
MNFGILTENRKLAGTLSRQRSQVERLCGRWNELLISATPKRAAYRVSALPSDGNLSAKFRGMFQPAVPIFGGTVL